MPGVEAAVRTALAATPVVLVGGAVTSEYVGTTGFGILTSALLGIAVGATANLVAGRRRGAVAAPARLVAMAYAVLGAAYAFRFVVGGGQDPFGPAGQVLPPYAAAAAGAWLWTMPPRRTGSSAPDDAGSTAHPGRATRRK